MKWFIKCFKHYADFSGRARRKEFWMFALFNFIFAIVWIFLAAFVFAAINRHSNNYELINAINVAYLSYLIAVMLPGMAVAVRRLHDVGKSGWMILVGLIPLVGGIWLLVLMLTDSQPNENQYGPNPKISTETFGEQAKLKSAGIVLTIASIAMIFMHMINLIMLYIANGAHLFMWKEFVIREISYFVAQVMLLIAGTFLLNEKQTFPLQGKGRNAIALLFAATSIYLILNIMQAISIPGLPPDIGFKSIIWPFINIVFYLLVAMFAAFILFSPQNKNLICSTATCIIIFSVLSLLWGIYIRMDRSMNTGIYDTIGWNPVIDRVFSLDILLPVAFIVLAGTFLSLKDSFDAVRQPVANSASTQSAFQTPPVKAASQGFYERDNRGMRVDDMGQSMSYWLIERMNSPRKDPFVYYVFKNESDARAALLELPFIHAATDTGKLICDELFRFGYFAVTNNGQLTGEYDAFVAGADFTHDMWEKTHTAFASHNGTKKNDLEPDKNTAGQHRSSAGNARNVTFVRENRDGNSIWMTYKAPSKADAMAFLSQQQITRPLYYVVVETPEGNFGKDKDGFYQE